MTNAAETDEAWEAMAVERVRAAWVRRHRLRVLAAAMRDAAWAALDPLTPEEFDLVAIAVHRAAAATEDVKLQIARLERLRDSIAAIQTSQQG